MKSLEQFIKESMESTQSEDLQEEIGLALKEFGNIRNGFKIATIDDIKDAMYKAGFDFVEDECEDDKLVFVGEYIDTKYEVDLYSKEPTNVKGKFKIYNFQVFEQ